MTKEYSEYAVPYTDSQVSKDVELFANMRRLRFTNRCNNFIKVHPEDVAQHSYFTTQLSLIIADDLNNSQKFLDHFGRKLDVEVVMRKALNHDVPESITSDIPYNVKNHSDDLKKLIDAAELQIMTEAYDGCSSIFDKINKDSHECKQGLEGRVVDAADMLELAWYCYEEVCMGNRHMGGLLQKALKILGDYGISEYSKFVKTAWDMLSDTPTSAEIYSRVRL